MTRVLARLDSAEANGIRNVYCDLSASPMIDLAGARMLAELAEKLSTRAYQLRGRQCAWPRYATAARGGIERENTGHRSRRHDQGRARRSGREIAKASTFDD